MFVFFFTSQDLATVRKFTLYLSRDISWGFLLFFFWGGGGGEGGEIKYSGDILSIYMHDTLFGLFPCTITPPYFTSEREKEIVKE